MQDAKNEVIYVGKAKALKNRVSQYFANLASHTEKTRAMVSQIDHFDVIVADSEFEALILENSLIKRHQPHYNILLKDDKGYPYIRLTVKEPYPRFSLANRAAEDGARYFGPYGSRGSTQNIIDALRVALKLPSCSRKFPRDIGKERPCLNYHMGQCDGYCRKEMDQTRYREAIDRRCACWRGSSRRWGRSCWPRWSRRRRSCASRRPPSCGTASGPSSCWASGRRWWRAPWRTPSGGLPQGGATRSCFVVLHYVEGELAAKDWELIETPMEEDRADILSALVGQYYGGRGRLPRQILLPCELEDAVPLMRLLSEQAGHRVELVTPSGGQDGSHPLGQQKRGGGGGALDHPGGAAEQADGAAGPDAGSGRAPPAHRVLRHLQPGRRRHRGLHGGVRQRKAPQAGLPPLQAEGHGRPRRLCSMEQVLTRRFQRYLDGDEKFSDKPDLLLIDGGVNHANVAVRVLESLGLRIPIFGMVKDDRHRTRALVTPEGKEIGIQGNQAIFSLIGQIQEETHRFAIEFHRQQQNQRVRGSVLDQIPGVGEKRRAELLKAFKSIKNIKSATLAELEDAVPKNTARAVYDFFHQKGEEPSCE